MIVYFLSESKSKRVTSWRNKLLNRSSKYMFIDYFFGTFTTIDLFSVELTSISIYYCETKKHIHLLL